MSCEFNIDQGYKESSQQQILNTRFRYRFGKEFVLDLLPTDDIVWLDIGTNQGYGLPELSFNGKGAVFAIDLDSKYLNEAKLNNPHVNAQIMDGCNLAFKDESINSVSCFEVIEHVSCAEALEMIQEIHRVLKPSGILILSTPNRGASGKRRTSPDHKHEYTPREMNELLDNNGFCILEKLGLGFIKEGSLLSKIYRGARDSSLASYAYYNILPATLRMKFRDHLQSQLQTDRIRKPKDGETTKNLYYICQKKNLNQA